MKYDFETVINRSELGSAKWAMMKRIAPDVPDGVIPFSVADMELKNAPQIIKGLREYFDEDKVSLGYTMYTKNYLDAVNSWMKRRHGWEVDMDWLVQSPGVVSVLYNSVRAYTEPGDGILMFSPVYYPFYMAATMNDRIIVDIPLVLNESRYEIDWEGFKTAAMDAKNKLLLFCSPHNPVGRVWSREELQRVSDICLESGVIVISDEIHNDLIMPGNSHTVFATISNEAAMNTIMCTSPSKSFSLAGLQVSNNFVPDETLRKKLKDEMMRNAMHTLNAVSYRACEIAYNECEDWLDQVILLISENAHVTERYMKENIPEIRVLPMEGTYLQWWDCRQLFDDHLEMEAFMQKKAFLFLDEGYVFGETGKGFERINLACPTWVLREALGRLGEAVKQLGVRN